MHRIFARHGAERLVVTAHLTAADRHALKATFPEAPVRVVCLRADAKAFADHVRERTAGNGDRLAADDLLGASESYQAIVVRRALDEQQALEDEAIDDAVYDVSGRAPASVVAEIEAAPVV
jgi:hypothetical protein